MTSYLSRTGISRSGADIGEIARSSDAVLKGYVIIPGRLLQDKPGSPLDLNICFTRCVDRHHPGTGRL